MTPKFLSPTSFVFMRPNLHSQLPSDVPIRISEIYTPNSALYISKFKCFPPKNPVLFQWSLNEWMKAPSVWRSPKSGSQSLSFLSPTPCAYCLPMPLPPSVSPPSSWPFCDVLYVVEREFFAKYKSDFITLCLKPFSNLPQLPLQSPQGSSWSTPTRVTTASAPCPQEAPTPAGLPGGLTPAAPPGGPRLQRTVCFQSSKCTIFSPSMPPPQGPWIHFPST